MKSSVGGKIDNLANQVDKQTNEMSNFKKEVKEMKKRIQELENLENEMVDAVENRWKEKERKRDLADVIKKDFEDETSKLLVIGYNYARESSRSITDRRIAAMMRDNTQPLSQIEIL